MLECEPNILQEKFFLFSSLLLFSLFDLREGGFNFKSEPCAVQK